MGTKSMVNLDWETVQMKNALISMDGWNFSFQTREMIRSEHKKAVEDGKLNPLAGKENDNKEKQ